MARVLMLLENAFPSDDRVEKEALSLIAEGHKVFLLCPDFSDRPKQENYKGIYIFRFSISKSYFKKLLGLIQLFPFYKTLWLKKVRTIVAEQKIEIVHIHDLPLCCLIRPLKKKYDLKIVADMHENYPAMVSGQEHLKKFPNKYLINVKKWYRLERKWLRTADLIVCTASGMVKRLKQTLKGEKQFVLVPNTLEIDEFNASQQRDMAVEERISSRFNILSYGVVSEQRGIQFVIDAIKNLKENIPKINLIVLGDGSYLPKLKVQAQRLGLGDNIAFEGWQNQSSLISYMQHTDICVIPHIKSEHTDNTSPNKLFHFMHFSKPIVASDCNYIQEIVEEENCGLIYRFDRPDQMATAIQKLYADKELRIEMGNNGKKAIQQKYNWQLTVRPLMKAYETLTV